MSNDTIKSICPLKIDFAIFVVNKNEEEYAKEIFHIDKLCNEKGVNYEWGYQINESGYTVTVALVSFVDLPGQKQAVDKTKMVVDTLNPNYILVLGTAGGIRRKNDLVKEGDLVISCFLHCGTVDTGKRVLNSEQIVQPNKELFECAHLISNTKWKNNETKIFIKEIGSGDILHQNTKEITFQIFKNKYHRVLAVEMEAGGVASALYNELSRSGKCPGYLVIKGISDIIKPLKKDKKLKYKTKSQDKTRHGPEGKLASKKSAEFSYDLINKFNPSYKTPISGLRIIPTTLGHIINNNMCCGIFYNVFAENYSDIALQTLNRLSNTNYMGVNEIFLTFTFSPKRLYELIENGFKNDQHRDPKNDEEMINWTEMKYPHFRNFEKLKDKFSIRRILILKENEDKINSSSEIENMKQWDFFEKLNGKIPCWVTFRDKLKDIEFLSDYVILGDKLLLDYYDESKMLIISDISFNTYLTKELLKLKSLFIKDKDTGFMFREITDFSTFIKRKIAK